MGKRRDGREAAVQFLFQHDLQKGEPAQELLEPFWQLRPAAPNTRLFSDELIRGVLENREAIDAQIRKTTANYELDRIAAVDRNILRVAIFEMLFAKDVPPIVCINEAIEIAKRFGSEDSGRFINGILDRTRKEMTKSKTEMTKSE